MPEPFLIFSWNAPFLPAFRNMLLEDAKRGAIPLVISRSTWPGQYLRAMYLREAQRGADSASRLLPRFLTLDQAIESWYASVCGETKLMAGPLDQVKILFDAVHEATIKTAGRTRDPLHFDAVHEAKISSLLPPPGAAGGAETAPGDSRRHLGDLDLAGFFPWGLRLADLLDEMFANLVNPADMPNLDGEVQPYAVDLLGRLGHISSRYLSELERLGMTTPGLMLKTVAENADGDIPGALAPSDSRPVYLIGFHTLNAGRDAVLKSLWQAGARVCLHADPNLTDGGPVHWTCARFREWMTSWGARPETAVAGAPARKPDVTFFSGFDLHSQLAELKENLGERNRKESSVIILPYSRVLMPVLHHLPDEDRAGVNVSLGVPLSEAPVFQLIHALFALQLKRLGTPGHWRYHWKELLDVLSSPLLSGLAVNGLPLEPILEKACAAVRTGRRYTDPFEDVATEEHALFSGHAEEAAALKTVLEATVAAFAGADTPQKAGQALTSLLACVKRYITDETRARASMDMECLYRLENAIIPTLTNSLMAEDTLPLETLSVIMDGLMGRQSIFFEPPAERLVLLQVMGVMESLLLDFDSVYIVEATDEHLPGVKKRDPLLPDSLRDMLNLPDLNDESREKGYAVMRLCHCAKNVHFYWQEGIRSGMFNERRTKSRFVEEYIWDRELHKDKKILTRGKEPLRVPRMSLTPMGPADRLIDLSRSPAVREEMDRLLKRKISPSTLDTYVQCPARFGLSRLAHFSEPDEVNEGDNPAEVGSLLHDVLQKFHQKRLNEPLPPGDKRGPLKDELITLFDQCLHDSSCTLTSTLPPESLYALTAAADRRLRDYLESQPENARPIRLETEFEAPIKMSGGTFTLGGRFDRLDRRGEDLTILDYKTGTIHSFKKSFWYSGFFAEARRVIESGEPRPEDVEKLMEAIRQGKGSVQLPAYIAIASSPKCRYTDPNNRSESITITGKVTDACFVELRDKGQERSFCDLPEEKSEGDEKLLQDALKNAWLLPAVVLLSMSMADTLKQRRGLHCQYCPFLSLCQS